MAPSRIDELRRRVQNDPASIAFAQLAEEYRRSGQTEEAVRVCREGLTRHPGYLSARVTLGRALLDLGQLAGAREELQFVVAEAPENLAAVRGLAEIFHRDGQTAEALTYYQRALALARHDPEIEEIVQQLSRQVGAAAASPNGGLSFEEAHQELLSAAERVPLAAPQESPLPGRNADHGSTAPFDFDRLVAALGSPAAPPQVDAAVEGRTDAETLELPEPASLGPDPFAALEAELRASEVTPPAAKVPPWSPPDAGDVDTPAVVEPQDMAVTDYVAGDVTAPAPSAADVLADTLLTYAPDTAGDAGDEGSEAEGAMSDPFSTSDEGAAPVEAPLVESEPVLLAGEIEPSVPEPADATGAGAEVAEDSSGRHAADEIAPADVPAAAAAHETVSDEAGHTEAPAAPAAVTPVEAAPPEGVLDELESWLTTLQDRSNT